MGIVVAGLLVGIQTYPLMAANSTCVVLGLVVQIIFTVDCALRLFSEGATPWLFWCGPDYGWNIFDVSITAICWVPSSALPINVAFIRMLRLIRLVKLVRRIKQLRVIVGGLFSSLSAVRYIAILLVIVFYLYAVIGVSLFRRNDPFAFGNVGLAMLTLYRLATFEAWTNLVYVNYYGCNSQNLGAIGVR